MSLRAQRSNLVADSKTVMYSEEVASSRRRTCSTAPRNDKVVNSSHVGDLSTMTNFNSYAQ
jgi:hypothetical protein